MYMYVEPQDLICFGVKRHNLFWPEKSDRYGISQVEYLPYYLPYIAVFLAISFAVSFGSSPFVPSEFTQPASYLCAKLRFERARSGELSDVTARIRNGMGRYVSIHHPVPC